MDSFRRLMGPSLTSVNRMSLDLANRLSLDEGDQAGRDLAGQLADQLRGEHPQVLDVGPAPQLTIKGPTVITPEPALGQVGVWFMSPDQSKTLRPGTFGARAWGLTIVGLAWVQPAQKP